MRMVNEENLLHGRPTWRKEACLAHPGCTIDPEPAIPLAQDQALVSQDSRICGVRPQSGKGRLPGIRRPGKDVPLPTQHDATGMDHHPQSVRHQVHKQNTVQWSGEGIGKNVHVAMPQLDIHIPSPEVRLEHSHPPPDQRVGRGVDLQVPPAQCSAI